VPLLAEHHTVIVPDLRGASESAKPETGYDKKTLAGGGLGQVTDHAAL
jgi:hypothetical protein